MTKKIRSEKELKGMLVKVNDVNKALVKFVSTDVFIDTDVKVADNYEHPHVAGTDDDGKSCFYPTYYALKLNVNFAQDVKNVSGKGDDVKAKNAEILKNAVGFKAVCRDLSETAKKQNAKGFLKMTASLPCEKSVNPNGSISNLWLFTTKELRQDFLDMIQTGINDGKYHLETKKSKSSKPLKAVLTLQATLKACGVEKTYEECEILYKENKNKKA